MKKYLLLVSVLLASVVSCTKNDIQAPSDNYIQMTVLASNDGTKTAIIDDGDGTYSTKWTSGDKIQVLEFSNGTLSQAVESSALASDTEVAEYNVSLASKSTGSYKYYAVYPSTSYGTGGEGDSKFYRLALSTEQTYTTSTYGPEGDLMITAPVAEAVATQPSSVNLQFKRIGTAVCMTVKGMTADETIQRIDVSSTAYYLAGYSKYDPENATWNGTYTASNKSIKITPTGTIKTTGTDVIWFRAYAGTLETDLSIRVITDAAIYSKTIDLAGNSKSIVLKENGLTKFSVAGFARQAKSKAGYKVVTNVNQLFAGDKILFVYKSGDTYRVNGGCAGSYLESVNDAVVDNSVLTTTSGLPLTVGIDGSNFTFSSNDGYLVSTAAKNVSFSNNENEEGVKTWSVSITSTGTATVQSTTTTYGYLKYNSTSPRFTTYASGQSAISIYKYDDGKPDSDIAFSASEKTIGLDDAVADMPTISKSNSGSVSYSSSKPAVATVNESTGVVTLVGVGETVITASVAADDTYRAGRASYTLTVTAPTREFSVNTTSINVVAAGESGKTITVTASPKVVWSMAVEDGITVTACTATKDGENYKGSGVITFSVAENSGIARVLPIILGTSTQYAATTEITVNVNQAGAVVAKTFEVSPLSITNVAAAGETKEVTINAADGVAWELSDVTTGLTFSVKSGNATAEDNYAIGTASAVLNVIVPKNGEDAKNYSFKVVTSDVSVVTKSYTVSLSQLSGLQSGSYTEDFEKQTASTTYTDQQTYTAANSNAGIGWYVEHGTVSTTGALTGTNSMHMRAYYAASSAAGTWNGALPYVYSKTGVKGLTSVTFNAAASNPGIKYDTYYSTDGSNWTAIQTGQSLTTSSKGYSFNIPNSSPSTSYYIKIAASSSSTHTASPSKSGNYTFRVDDIVFNYSAASN